MRWKLFTVCAVLTAACSDSVTPTPAGDASVADGALDATPDVSPDVSPDTAPDAIVDPPPDAGCGIAPSTDPTVALTDRGLVRGVVDGESLRWLGVPYAQPPVGAARWREPLDVTACWTTPRDATAWAPACAQIPQQQGQPFDPAAPMVGQEDCLTLNVWRPANAAADATLPVMVFLHGGGNVVGSAGETSAQGQRLYDASRLASRGNVVVVTVQYRLGALGFLHHPALEAESPAGVGNYALLDQIAALRWVQRNARAFRGDPSRVLLFGESAGALDTCALVAAPRAQGLFSRAIVESGSCTAMVPVETARTTGQSYAEATRCAGMTDVAACLRALPVDAAVRALQAPVDVSGLSGSALRWGPVSGAAALPERPLDAMLAGRQNRVSFMIGHNANEVGLAVPAVPTEAAYRAALVNVGGVGFADMVMARYPVSAYATPRAALVQALTDARFGCGARHGARASVAGRNPSTYRYLFAHALEGSTAVVRAIGPWHGLELLYVFQNVAQGMLTPTPNDLAVERAMLGYWTRFAATGDPNGGSDLAWPAYATGEPLLQLAATPAVQRAWRGSECDFWDGITRTTAPAP